MNGFIVTFEVSGSGSQSAFEAMERAIHQAAARFQERTGLAAKVVWINPNDMPALPEGQKELVVGGMIVRAKVSVLPRHVWAGVADE